MVYLALIPLHALDLHSPKNFFPLLFIEANNVPLLHFEDQLWGVVTREFVLRVKKVRDLLCDFMCHTSRSASIECSETSSRCASR